MPPLDVPVRITSVKPKARASQSSAAGRSL
jgi:hypothetical protein